MNIISKFKKSKSDKVKYFCVIFGSLLAVFLVLFYFYKDSEIRAEKLIIERFEANAVNECGSVISTELDGVFSDLMYIEDITEEYINNLYSYEHISENILMFCWNKRVYDQIRYIDEDGNEKIRVNYNNGDCEIVKKENLQNKKDRYYFEETALQKEGQIFISKFDLNVENRVIEEPLKPMIRFSTPIYDGMEFKGIVIINYAANNLIHEFNRNSDNTIRNIALLNRDSYWLISTKEDEQWGFMYEDMKNTNYSNRFPKEWDKIINEKEGQFYSDNGLFTFSTIDSILNINKRNYVFEDAINFFDKSWVIVSRIGNDDKQYSWVNNSTLKLVIKDLFEYYYIIILVFLSSIAVTILFVLNKEYKEEINYFAKYDDMTKVFNRRAGLEVLDGEVKKSILNNDFLSICFIDINGLKVINDSLGHDAGDDLIITVANAIKESTRDKDAIIRLGGDEFLIVLPGFNKIMAEKIWSRINNKLININNSNKKSFNISVSHGISEYMSDSRDSIDLTIKLADEKMYEEKRIIKANLEEFNSYLIKGRKL